METQYGQDPYKPDFPVTQQPQPQPYAVGNVTTQQNVVVIQQGAAATPMGQWSTGLCGCFEDMGSCLAAWFCLPFFRCYLASKMGESCCMPICIPQADLIILRMKMRTMNNIPGGAISDCCAATFCTTCVAAQLSREWDNTVNTLRR